MVLPKLYSSIKNSFLHLIYPPHCIHCEEATTYPQSFFCSGCVSLLEIIDTHERCSSCFSFLSHEAGKCPNCKNKDILFEGIASVFDYLGPPASLVKKIKYANHPFLAEGAAGFLVAQWERLNWPIPDALIPVPISFLKLMDRGFNQCELLANEMSKLMDVPVWKALSRKNGDYSQAGLDLVQRKKLRNNNIRFNKKYNVTDKTLLIIDDVLTTGTTLRCCGEVLIEGMPAKLYALTVCCA